MQKPTIVTKVNCNQFGKLCVSASHVYECMNDNSNFINPQPPLPVYKACLDDLTEAIAKWGPKGNRGSHIDYGDLKLKARTMHSRLTQLRAWCMSSIDPDLSYDDQKQILSTSGFPLKNERTPVGTLQAVQNFHRFIARNVNLDSVKLKWAKPLAVATNTNVKSYNVYRNSTGSFTTATIIASIPYTSYIDSPGQGTWFYWVVPVNNKGGGVPSSSLMVKIA